MFEFSVSHWALHLANGICGVPSKNCPAWKFRKNDWVEFPVKQVLYTHADLQRCW